MRQIGLNFGKPRPRSIGVYPSARADATGLLSQCLCIPEIAINQSLKMLEAHSDESPAYIRFFLRKKSGGKREIRAPVDPLKGLLRSIYVDLLAPFPLNRHVHGFRPRRTIVTNAAAHLATGAQHLVNWDIKECFPSTPIKMIRIAYEDTVGRTLRREGIPNPVVNELIEILARLSTLRYGRASTEVLPMGSPTSPCLLNHVLNEFDILFARQLARLGKHRGTIYTYTRYGDDLSVSSPDPLPTALFGLAPSLLSKWGYRVHPDKTKVMHKNCSGKPMEVTGLVIGDERLLISDHTLSKYELIVVTLLKKPTLTPREKSVLRGILGITKMIYGPELAPRIANAIDRMRKFIGEEVDRRLSPEEDETDQDSPESQSKSYDFQRLINDIPTEVEGFLDPTGGSDPFQHEGSWEDL